MAGEDREVFQAVAEIYRHAKAHHGIAGSILIILVEDETKVKSQVSWEHRRDALTGFCGPKEDHVCVPTYEVVVEARTSGYDNILNAFSADKVGGFARVIMVYPLHASLSHLVLTVTCTCGCFDSAWVRNQWDRIDVLWSEECF